MCHDNKEWCKIWRGIDLSVQNWHEEFDEFWPEHSKISKICTLMGCFWPKYIMFELKKYRRVMFDGTEDWCKIWRKTDLYFLKWHEEFGKFSPEHVRKSKNWVFSWVLLSKVKNVWVWNLQGCYVSWEWREMQNLKKNWLVNSKLIWVTWWILSRALENLKSLHFNGLLLTIVYNVWSKKVKKSYFWLHWRWMYKLKANWQLTCTF